MMRTNVPPHNEGQGPDALDADFLETAVSDVAHHEEGERVDGDDQTKRLVGIENMKMARGVVPQQRGRGDDAGRCRDWQAREDIPLYV